MLCTTNDDRLGNLVESAINPTAQRIAIDAALCFPLSCTVNSYNFHSVALLRTLQNTSTGFFLQHPSSENVDRGRRELDSLKRPRPVIFFPLRFNEPSFTKRQHFYLFYFLDTLV